MIEFENVEDGNLVIFSSCSFVKHSGMTQGAVYSNKVLQFIYIINLRNSEQMLIHNCFTYCCNLKNIIKSEIVLKANYDFDIIYSKQIN